MWALVVRMSEPSFAPKLDCCGSLEPPEPLDCVAEPGALACHNALASQASMQSISMAEGTLSEATELSMLCPQLSENTVLKLIEPGPSAIMPDSQVARLEEDGMMQEDEDEDDDLSVTIESVLKLTRPEKAMPRKSERERFLEEALESTAEYPLVAPGPESRLMGHQLAAAAEALREERKAALDPEEDEEDVLVEADKVKYHRCADPPALARPPCCPFCQPKCVRARSRYPCHPAPW